MTPVDTAGEALRREVLLAGASLVGFADLAVLPSESRHGLPRGLSVAVALSPQAVAGNAEGPSAGYLREYRRANALLGVLARLAASLLLEGGHRAVALDPTTEDYDRGTLSHRLPHKTAATRAGLGWVGKCALLVTPSFGAAVRLCTVLTDAPLATGSPVTSSACGDCRACVDACPAGAPSGRPWEAGLPREEFFDAFACQRTCRELSTLRGIDATICGRCLVACPHTRRYLLSAGKAGVDNRPGRE